MAGIVRIGYVQDHAMGATESACHTWINETTVGTLVNEPISSFVRAHWEASLRSGSTIVLAEQPGTGFVEPEYPCVWDAWDDLRQPRQ